MTYHSEINNGIAPLKNVQALLEVCEGVTSRPYGLPGIGVFYGPSGFGKTTAATFAANEYDAVFVAMRSRWTMKFLCRKILEELSITDTPKGAQICEMIDVISKELAERQTLLMIDEADYLLSQRNIEVVRDIYEGSDAPVILIGEELMPQKLQKWERVAGRVSNWRAAEEASFEEVALLAPIYAPQITIEEPLQRKLFEAANGSARRISVNLNRVAIEARTMGKRVFGVKDWGNRAFETGTPPRPRRS